MSHPSELDQHMDAYRRAYDQVNPNAPESFKVWWANRVADSIPLQAALSTTGRGWPTKYAAEDYLSDDEAKR